MKKILSILLAAAMVMSMLAGCGNSGSDVAQEPAAEEPAAEAESTGGRAR